MAGSGSLQWSTLPILTALSVSAVVLAQFLSVYTAAYLAAPQEITTFVDTADFSVQENEGYDRDVAKVQRLEDKIRLTHLLREIQRGGDGLREDLNGFLVEEGSTKLRTTARLLWASHRSRLEDRVRRLDLLRMRFLVLYMGVIMSNAEKLLLMPPRPPPAPPVPTAKALEKSPVFQTPPRPSLPKGLSDGIVSRPPLRRLTAPAPVSHQEPIQRPPRKGWAGVVEELQTSPKMIERHASIERAMSMSQKSQSP